MNTFKVYHYDSTNLKWEEISSPIFPFSFGDYLDERLDEAYVTFYSETDNYTTTDVFKVEIYEGKPAPEKTLYYICGNDEAEELPVGSGNYKHKIFLMETTKLLEGVVCQTLTFTNDAFASNLSSKIPKTTIKKYVIYNYGGNTEGEKEIDEITDGNGYKDTLYFDKLVPNSYTPVTPGTVISLKSTQYYAEALISFYGNSVVDATKYQILDGESNLYYTINDGQKSTVPYNQFRNVTLVYGETLTAEYVIKLYRADYTGSITPGEPTSEAYYKITFSYSVECKYGALVPYTITTMTKRVLELAEPLCRPVRSGAGTIEKDIPRFIFDGIKYDKGSAISSYYSIDKGSQAEKYNKIRADEIALTQATLREQLRTVAGPVHCEPRVEISESTSGGKTTLNYTVKYEPYDKRESARLEGKKYSYKKLSCSINEYCTELRSNAQNIVNAKGYGKGVLKEPNNSGYLNIRPLNVNERVQESNGRAVTSYPIYKIIKVMCGVFQTNPAGYIDNKDGKFIYVIPPVDITFRVVEKAAYDLKSAYPGEGLLSKNEYIYYTQGASGLDGLFVKALNTSIAEPFEEYAIARILAFYNEEGLDDKTVAKLLSDYPAGLFFQITYIPIYPALLSHGKQKFIPGQTPFAQIYNQSENLIEAHYYGENVKGAAARLGNVEEERTYIFDSISEIPTIGTTVDGYSIAAARTETYPLYYKTTLALSKHFNRINPYVGVSSNKRVYEVSEREAYERSILYKDIILVSKTAPTSTGGAFASDIEPFVQSIIGATAERPNPISAVYSVFWMKGRSDSPGTASIALPVVSSAFGNSILFSWTYKDNYSAGEQLKYNKSDASIIGFWGNDVPYGDYYGRGDYYKFYLRREPEIYVDANQTQLDSQQPITLPQIPRVHASDVGIEAETLVLKDSREKLSFNLEFEFKTTEDNIIIGSGAASCSWLVDSSPSIGSLRLFKEPIGSLQQTTIGMTVVDTIAVGSLGYKVEVDDNVAIITFPEVKSIDYASWAICFPVNNTPEYFTDVDGKVKAFTQPRGGEIFIAGNGSLPTSPLYISIQHE